MGNYLNARVGNYVNTPLGNYLTLSRSRLGNYLAADTSFPLSWYLPCVASPTETDRA